MHTVSVTSTWIEVGIYPRDSAVSHTRFPPVVHSGTGSLACGVNPAVCPLPQVLCSVPLLLDSGHH